MPGVNPYARHTLWSDPGAFRAALNELPAEPDAIADALEQFVMHPTAAVALGCDIPMGAEADKNLRSAERLIEAAINRGGGPLTQARAANHYLFGTCRDFALLAAAILREHGVPARLRVGYASYFEPGRWEDHWVCEYRTGKQWALLDAELGPRARARFGIDFDLAHVPRDRWRSAASVWHAIKSGLIEANSCGVSIAGIAGDWFVAAAILRDAAALAGIEALPWDYWGPGRSICKNRCVPPERVRDIDDLADALDPAPDTYGSTQAVLERFPWARPSPTVLSFPDGRTPTEVALAPQG
ncbi:MAG TPA: transglutaminase-like domain-containing protein [Stellaceae bacterium]|nr:transglutaminase-like domain-containing protein [Stellaceae bacterium]